MAVRVNLWFERDRAMVRVYEEETDREIACWWDEEVGELVEMGFLDPRDYKGSAIRYCEHLGLL